MPITDKSAPASRISILVKGKVSDTSTSDSKNKRNNLGAQAKQQKALDNFWNGRSKDSR